MITDPIADFLTRIRNAVNAKHRIVEVPASNVKKATCHIQVFINNILYGFGGYSTLARA